MPLLLSHTAGVHPDKGKVISWGTSRPLDESQAEISLFIISMSSSNASEKGSWLRRKRSGRYLLSWMTVQWDPEVSQHSNRFQEMEVAQRKPSHHDCGVLLSAMGRFYCNRWRGYLKSRTVNRWKQQIYLCFPLMKVDKCDPLFTKSITHKCRLFK